MNFLRKYGASAALAAMVAIVCTTVGVRSAGLFPNLPIFGGASFCAGGPGVNPAPQPVPLGAGINQAGANPCNVTVPAGPTAFVGTEVFPIDIVPGSATMQQVPETVSLRVAAMGNGPVSVVTSPATATIPNNTPIYVLNGAQGSAFTITMPAGAFPGDVQRIVCGAATVGSLTVAANTNQTIIGTVGAACAANRGYAWVLNGTQWVPLN